MADNYNANNEAEGRHGDEDNCRRIVYPVTIGWVKYNKPRTSVYVLDSTADAIARYHAVFDADPTLTSQAEAIRRAGGTFYKHWYESEMIRFIQSPTMATKIAFGELENDEENLLAAEEELGTNKLGKEEAQLLEERKTIARLRIELRDGLESFWLVQQRNINPVVDFKDWRGIRETQ